MANHIPIINFSMKNVPVLLFALVFFLSWALEGKAGAERESPDILKLSSFKVNPDTITKKPVPADTSKKGIDTLKVPISASALGSPVTYTAKDSIIYDIANKKVYLYGTAHIEYQDIKLDAAFITIDNATSTICAEGMKDSSGKVKGLPVFKQGQDELHQDQLCYNFRTKKGRTEQGKTQEGEGFIHYEVAKTVKENGKDVIFAKNGWYTTCNLPDTPHFYIKTNKMKLLPKDKVITGPAYLVVEQIPIPLIMPFGFFPANSRKSSGIIIPAVGESDVRGFALRNGGFYYGGSEYFDAALTGDIYTGGSYRVNLASRYALRYRFGGNINISYASNQFGLKETKDYYVSKDFFVTWRHSLAQKARPNSTFSADVNAGSSKYLANNSYRANDILTQTLSSRISYTTMFPGTPFNLGVSLDHSQQIRTGEVDLNLPNINFGMSRITPFRTKNTVTRKWYTDLGFTYNLNFKNHLKTKDTFFKQDILNLNRYSNGFTHSIPISTSIRILKYFNLSPGISYNGWIYTKKLSERFDPDTYIRGRDTLRGRVITDTTQGLFAVHEVAASLGLSTKIYGMMNVNRGRLVAIRHVLTPSISGNYRPDFNGGLRHTVQTDIFGHTRRDFIYESSVAGQPSFGRVGGIGFSLENNFEMKVKNKADTVNPTKKVMLLDHLGFTGAYNFLADSFKLSNIGISARTSLFQIITIDGSAALDPYYLNPNGRRVDRYDWNSRGRLGRISTSNLSAGLNLNPKARKKQSMQSPVQRDANALMAYYYPYAYADFSIPWDARVDYTLTYDRYTVVNGKITAKSNSFQSVRFGGEMNLTANWKISGSSGYDFVAKNLTLTSISIHRDLHCWEMSIDWIPFGPRRSYFFNIHIKAASLRDLKLEKRKEFYDF